MWSSIDDIIYNLPQCSDDKRGRGQGDEVVVSEVQECEGGQVVEQVVGQPSDAAPRQLQPRVLVAVLVEGHQGLPGHTSRGEDPCRGELIIVKHVLLIFI